MQQTIASAVYKTNRFQTLLASRSIHSEHIFIDGPLAVSMLERNKNNRHLRPRVVENYVRDMVNGAWRNTGQTITFSEAGNLLDGQHRLTAIAEVAQAKPGFSLPMVVVFGVPENAVEAIDRGAPRSLRDTLKLSGVTAENTLIRAARLLNMLRGTQPTTSASGRRYIASGVETTDAIRGMLERERGLEEARRIALGIPRRWMAKEIATALCYETSLLVKDGFVNQWHVAFWQGVSEGANLDSQDPRLQLRNRLIDNLTTSPSSTVAKLRTQWDFFRIVARAWNNYMTSSYVDRLVIGKGGQSTPSNIPMLYSTHEEWIRHIGFPRANGTQHTED